MQSQTIRALVAICAVLTVPCVAGCNDSEMSQKDPVEERVKTKPNGAAITLVGTIVESGPDGFTLDYGSGSIVVEMDNLQADADAAMLFDHDQVVVRGFIDDDFFERRTIEASSVYLPDLGTHFYASGLDEEDLPMYSIVDYHPRVEVGGTVKSVDGRTFTLDTGIRTLEVETASLPYNPMDDEGFQQIDEGDVVRVRGLLDESLFANLELMAQSIMSVQRAGGDASSSESQSS